MLTRVQNHSMPHTTSLSVQDTDSFKCLIETKIVSSYINGNMSRFELFAPIRSIFKSLVFCIIFTLANATSSLLYSIDSAISSDQQDFEKELLRTTQVIRTTQVTKLSKTYVMYDQEDAEELTDEKYHTYWEKLSSETLLTVFERATYVTQSNRMLSEIIADYCVEIRGDSIEDEQLASAFRLAIRKTPEGKMVAPDLASSLLESIMDDIKYLPKNIIREACSQSMDISGKKILQSNLMNKIIKYHLSDLFPRQVNAIMQISSQIKGKIMPNLYLVEQIMKQDNKSLQRCVTDRTIRMVARRCNRLKKRPDYLILLKNLFTTRSSAFSEKEKSYYGKILNTL